MNKSAAGCPKCGYCPCQCAPMGLVQGTDASQSAFDEFLRLREKQKEEERKCCNPRNPCWRHDGWCGW